MSLAYKIIVSSFNSLKKKPVRSLNALRNRQGVHFIRFKKAMTTLSLFKSR